VIAAVGRSYGQFYFQESAVTEVWPLGGVREMRNIFRIRNSCRIEVVLE
jgi:hypothetical protein